MSAMQNYMPDRGLLVVVQVVVMFPHPAPWKRGTKIGRILGLAEIVEGKRLKLASTTQLDTLQRRYHLAVKRRRNIRHLQTHHQIRHALHSFLVRIKFVVTFTESGKVFPRI